MTESKPTSFPELSETPCTIAPRKLKVREISPRKDKQLDYIASSSGGIVLAGALYPIVLAVIIFLFELFRSGGTDITSLVFTDIPSALVAIVVISLALLIAGFILSGITGIAAIFLVYIVNTSMGNPMPKRISAITAGSLAGYSPTAFLFYEMPFIYYEMPFGGIQEYVLGVTLGPVLAMLMGAWGASWCVTRYTEKSVSFVPVRRTKYRLGITDLMVATAWFAAVFGLANFAGGMNFVVSVMIWIVLHSGLVGLYILTQRRKQEPKMDRQA